MLREDIEKFDELYSKLNSLKGDFVVFDLVCLPTNSDVLMMLNLYLNGMSRYKDANSTEHSSPIDWSSEFKTKTWDVED